MCVNNLPRVALDSVEARIRTRDLLMDIERVSTYTMLGVIVNDRLTATDHVNHLLSSAARLLYALRILRSHGTPT